MTNGKKEKKGIRDEHSIELYGYKKGLENGKKKKAKDFIKVSFAFFLNSVENIKIQLYFLSHFYSSINYFLNKRISFFKIFYFYWMWLYS